MGQRALARFSAGVLSGLWQMPRNPVAATFWAAFGILAGLGLLRWGILVPSLVASPADITAQAVFNAFRLYLGAGICEHFGCLLTALWTQSVSVALMALAGIVEAIGMAVGMAEPFGFAAAGLINAISYTAWAV